MQPILVKVLDAVRIGTIRRILGAKRRFLYQDFPWRKDHTWHGLVAEVLLQRTRATQVAPVYLEFKERFPTPVSLSRARIETIRRLIAPLGLRWRAPLLKQLGRDLARLGQVPQSREDLVCLPGVGPYVAAAWLSLHLGKREVMVDSNIVRWVARMRGEKHDGETRRAAWVGAFLDDITPTRNVTAFSYGVLDFSMRVCAPTPNCARCPFALNRMCAGRMSD